jgi:hypothetical protein
MKKIISIALWLAAGAAFAAEPANPLSFAGGKLVFDVQERLRLEVRDNNFDFNNNADVGMTDQTFLLQRFRLGALFKPVDWFKVYAQGQDSREIASRRQKVPFVFGAEGDDPFDLRQAYIELGDGKACPMVLKVGRQELLYGDERLVGAFDWNNFARTFDAVKLRYDGTTHKFWVDAFYAHVVTIEQFGPQSNYGAHLNDANWNDTLVGLYTSTTCLTVQTTDLYLFYRNKQGNNPRYTGFSGQPAAFAYDIAQEIWTPGLRIKSLPGKLRGWDYELEIAGQFGRSAGQQGSTVPTSATSMMDHEAFAFHIAGGYTWEKCDWKPRLALEYNIASGDDNPNDNKDESFLNLFPTNHKFYGYMDFFAWKNVHNPALSLKLAPVKNVTVQLDGHAFWLYTNQDAWYRANAVTRVRPLNAAALNAGSFVGTEFDLTVTWLTPWKWMKWQAGYSHFFPGDYVRDTASGAAGSDGADFGYVMTTLTF